MTFQVYICENPDGFGLLSSVNHRRFSVLFIYQISPSLECST